jgi:hypothetical protein
VRRAPAQHEFVIRRLAESHAFHHRAPHLRPFGDGGHARDAAAADEEEQDKQGTEDSHARDDTRPKSPEP